MYLITCKLSGSFLHLLFFGFLFIFRMVVASSITTNEGGDKLTLRGTSVMPNIPGLPALMCLMFAPMVELRCNSSCTKLSGALCGLGYDPDTKKSLFPENDIELLFDVEFVLEDIALINKIRFWLNKAVDPAGGFDEDIDVKEWAKCRSHLIDLISTFVLLLDLNSWWHFRVILLEVPSSSPVSLVERKLIFPYRCSKNNPILHHF